MSREKYSHAVLNLEIQMEWEMDGQKTFRLLL